MSTTMNSPAATLSTAINPPKVSTAIGVNERRLIRRAMESPESCVLLIDYRDRSETRTRRVVSPIRFENKDSFLGLCLCREEPRRFDLDRCTNLRIAPAHEYSMPVPIENLDDKTPDSNGSGGSIVKS